MFTARGTDAPPNRDEIRFVSKYLQHLFMVLTSGVPSSWRSERVAKELHECCAWILDVSDATQNLMAGGGW